jgi:hypothetical protein
MLAPAIPSTSVCQKRQKKKMVNKTILPVLR